MLFNRNFFENVDKMREERNLVEVYLNKVGLNNPYDEFMFTRYEYLENKISKDVRKENFDLETVEENLKLWYNHIFIEVTHSDYFDVISEPKRISLKETLTMLYKGLVKLYQSEYKKEIRRKEEVIKKQREETLFEELLKTLKNK